MARLACALILLAVCRSAGQADNLDSLLNALQPNTIPGSAIVYTKDSSTGKKGVLTPADPNMKAVNCAFDIQQILNFVARLAFSIQSGNLNCPLFNIQVSQPHAAACASSLATLFTAFSQIAGGLAAAATDCEQSAFVDQENVLAANIAYTITPVSTLITGAITTAGSCQAAVVALERIATHGGKVLRGAPGNTPVATLPQSLPLTRRLQGLAGIPHGLLAQMIRWFPPGGPGIGPLIAEGFFDTTAAAMAVGQLGIAIASAVSACEDVQNKTSIDKAACVSQVTSALFAISRITTFLAVAAAHLSPQGMPPVFAQCVAGLTQFGSAATAAMSFGSQIYVSSQLLMRAQNVGADSVPIVDPNAGQPDFIGPWCSDFECPLGYVQGLNADQIIGASVPVCCVQARRLGSAEDPAAIPEKEKVEAWETLYQVWMSLGFNLSDVNATWLNREVPELELILEQGRKVAEHISNGNRQRPLVDDPEALGEPLAEEIPMQLSRAVQHTLNCSSVGMLYEPFGLRGQLMTIEDDIAACQARCANVSGCASFSFWSHGRHCHLHDVLAEPSPADAEWISGPPGCHPDHVSEATKQLLERMDSCFFRHSRYHHEDSIAEPVVTESALQCQQQCQRVQGCAHFSFAPSTGLCHFAKAAARRLEVVVFTISGPRRCSGAKPLGLSGGLLTGQSSSFIGMEFILIAVTIGALLFMAGFWGASLRRVRAECMQAHCMHSHCDASDFQQRGLEVRLSRTPALSQALPELEEDFWTY